MEKGANSITRSSTLSSVVKPPELTFAQLRNRISAQPAGKKSNRDCHCPVDRYCECGWPQHMLLPRGKVGGMAFDLFVMVTDWSADSSTNNLDQGTSYCGVKDKTYPDKRPMGFPFDRKIDGFMYPTVEKFAESFDNMITIPIAVKCVSGL